MSSSDKKLLVVVPAIVLLSFGTAISLRNNLFRNRIASARNVEAEAVAAQKRQAEFLAASQEAFAEGRKVFHDGIAADSGPQLHEADWKAGWKQAQEQQITAAARRAQANERRKRQSTYNKIEQAIEESGVRGKEGFQNLVRLCSELERDLSYGDRLQAEAGPPKYNEGPKRPC